MDPFTFWRDKTPVLSTINRLDSTQVLGLKNNTLFDTLVSDNNGNDTITVGAISFNVTCGYLSNVTAIGVIDSPGTPPTHWEVKSIYDGYDFEFDLPYMSKFISLVLELSHELVVIYTLVPNVMRSAQLTNAGFPVLVGIVTQDMHIQVYVYLYRAAIMLSLPLTTSPILTGTTLPLFS